MLDREQLLLIPEYRVQLASMHLYSKLTTQSLIMLKNGEFLNNIYLSGLELKGSGTLI